MNSVLPARPARTKSSHRQCSAPKSEVSVCLDFASHWEVRSGVWRYGVALAEAMARLLGPANVLIPCLDRLPQSCADELRRTGAMVKEGMLTSRIDFLDSLVGRRGRYVPWDLFMPLVYSPAVRERFLAAGVGTCDVYHGLFNVRTRPRSGAVVTTVHDLIPFLFPEESAYPLEKFLGILSRQRELADLVIVPSPKTRDDLIQRQGFSPEAIRVVCHGIDDKWQHAITPADREFLAERDLARGRYFLFVGTLERRKNIERLIEAYLVAVPADADVPLVLVGQTLQDLPVLNEALSSVPKRVRHLTNVADAELAALYRNTLALAHVALIEGFGFTPLEAMRSGAPVIVSKETASSQLIGEAGIVVDACDTVQIARALRTMLDDEPLRSRLSDEGTKLASQFTWERAARQTLAVYQEAIRIANERRGR